MWSADVVQNMFTATETFGKSVKKPQHKKDFLVIK